MGFCHRGVWSRGGLLREILSRGFCRCGGLSLRGFVTWVFVGGSESRGIKLELNTISECGPDGRWE